MRRFNLTPWPSPANFLVRVQEGKKFLMGLTLILQGMRNRNLFSEWQIQLFLSATNWGSKIKVPIQRFLVDFYNFG